MSVQELAGADSEIPESLQEFVEQPEEKAVEAPVEKAEPESVEVKADPLVEKARQGGWRPKEEWEGDPDQWVDAKEFVSRKPLFDKIHSLNKALKDRDDKLKTVSEYATKAFEKGQEAAIKELEEKRRAAVESGDIEAFESADKELQEVRKEQADAPKVEPEEIPDDIKDFAKRNEKWFEKDEEMTDYALMRARKYAEQGKPRSEYLPMVDADVRRVFPAKFENPNKQKPAAVAASGGEPKVKSYSYADLSYGQRKIWNSMKKVPGYTFENYVTDLKAQGDLK